MIPRETQRQILPSSKWSQRVSSLPYHYGATLQAVLWIYFIGKEHEEDALAFNTKELGSSPRHPDEAKRSLVKQEAEVLQLRPLLHCQRAAHPHSCGTCPSNSAVWRLEVSPPASPCALPDSMLVAKNAPLVLNNLKIPISIFLKFSPIQVK